MQTIISDALISAIILSLLKLICNIMFLKRKEDRNEDGYILQYSMGLKLLLQFH